MTKRRRGEKSDVTVCAPPDHFANNPQVIRTEREVVLVFGLQEIDKLRLLRTHHHYQPVARTCWAVSCDGGFTWHNTDIAPELGRIVDASYGVPLGDGGMVTITFARPFLIPHALIQRGRVGYMPYNPTLPAEKTIPLTDFGPFRHFYFHAMIRTSDGALLAAGYAPTPEDTAGRHFTGVFLRSEDDGHSWRYLSHAPAPQVFSFSETGLVSGKGGRVVVILRADWDSVPLEERPAEARVGYGYFLYQMESADNGRTWSEPVRLPLWGHPPFLLRLASGAILMVYGHRRPPYSVRAILSPDDGKTWDLRTLRTLRQFDPGNYDLGYPQATQLADGTVLCAYYGYSTDKADGMLDIHGNPLSLNPCGIFVSLFDEGWLRKGEHGIQP